MDGVTDAPCRTMHGLYGRPDVVLTEFTNVEGLWRGSDRIYRDFLYTPAERPVVAQIFGCQPEYFYKAAHVVCELGFDGLDVNMGCPARTIANRGGGAALIRVPDTATAKDRDGCRNPCRSSGPGSRACCTWGSAPR